MILIVISKRYFTAAVTVATILWSPESLALVLIDFDFLNVDFLALDGLLGGLKEFVDDVFGIKGDKAVASALIFRLVERSLDLNYRTVLTEVGLDIIVRDLGRKTTDKYFSMLGFFAYSFWINLKNVFFLFFSY